jgi:hypothetical protein
MAGRRVSANLSIFVDGVGSLRAVELLRIAAGPLVMIHLWPFFEDARAGLIYSDRYYLPYVSWYPEAPRDVYLILLWVAVPAAAALSIGLATRFSASYVAGFVGYNLFLSRTHFSHNRAFLLVLLLGVAVLPLGRRLSLDAAWRRRKGDALEARGQLWPLLLMRFEVASVFVASGTSKLIDPDWWGGTVTRLRIVRWRDLVIDRGVPEAVLDVLTSGGFHWWFAKAAVITELFIALGLIARRTRMGAIWVAVLFHVSIEVFASVQVFSYAALAALVIWITPSARDRTVIVRGTSRGSRLIEGAVRYLDWTARFRLRREDSGGPAVTLVDRDGSHIHGTAATRVILSRLPATFMVAAPFNLAGARRLWDREAQSSPKSG